jgi:toxin ParE1/3/4
MLPYELTLAAEADLREIARYTLRQWGERQVTRCEHHYVFYLPPEGQKPRIIAVLHENMDLLARLEDRLFL